MRSLLFLVVGAAGCGALGSTQSQWERAMAREQSQLEDEKRAVENEIARIERREEERAAAPTKDGKGDAVAASDEKKPAASTAHESEALDAMRASMDAAKAHDYELAKKKAEEAIELRPGFVDPMMMLAAIAQEKGDAEEARRRYRDVLQVDPTDTAAGNALGFTYLSEGRFDEAREWFQKAVDSDPGFEAAAFNLASVAEQKQEFETAAKWFDVSSTLDRRDPRGLVHVAEIRLAQSRPQEALDAAEAAIRRAPSYERAQAARARALAALGRTN